MTSRELEAWIANCFRMSGRAVLVLPPGGTKPYRFAVGEEAVAGSSLIRVYAWNATHGGGPRAADEFRIQLTGSMPESVDGETTVILGWSEAFQVFAGWDPQVHDHRLSASPSLQVRSDVMIRASSQGIAAGTRGSGDVVVAFRPELLAAYCSNVEAIHADPGTASVDWLNELPSRVQASEYQRPTVQRTLEVAYRVWDFARRVRRAYSGLCGICGLGLGLTEAAHIVPVAWPGGTDETKNGIAMCRNHHAAYDRGLISVSPDYTVSVSSARYEMVGNVRSGADVEWLSSTRGRSLFLPGRLDDRPDPEYLRLGQSARGFVS